MRKSALAIGLLVFALAAHVTAQETYFGKNKVRYRNFDWSYIQTRHFDLYFYDNSYPVAKFAADVMEKSYQEISEELRYNLQDRVPVFMWFHPVTARHLGSLQKIAHADNCVVHCNHWSLKRCNVGLIIKTPNNNQY